MYGNLIGRAFVLITAIGACALVEAATPKSEEGTKKLTMHAAGQAPGTTAPQFLLLPQEMTDGDAFPLYQKAIQSLPKDLNWEKISGWRKIPMGELPQDEVAAVLRRSDTSLSLLEQAGRYKECSWSPAVNDNPDVNLTGCRHLAFLVTLKARSQLAHADYASCVRTLGTGLALARHLNTGPSLIHVLVGVAVGAIIWGEIELYIQQPGAPGLAAALQSIPKPLFDEKHSDLYGMDEASRSRAQLLLMRANRHLIVLQYLETLRSYTATAHQWPQTLNDLKTNLPNDPVSGKPFSYKRLSDTQAVLEGPLPKGGDAKDNVRYELTLMRKL